MPIRVMNQVRSVLLRMTWLTLCPQFQVRSEGLLDTMTCLMDHLAERQEEEANFNFIEEKIAQPLIDMGVDITFEQVAALNGHQCMDHTFYFLSFGSLLGKHNWCSHSICQKNNSHA